MSPAIVKRKMQQRAPAFFWVALAAWLAAFTGLGRQLLQRARDASRRSSRPGE